MYLSSDSVRDIQRTFEIIESESNGGLKLECFITDFPGMTLNVDHKPNSSE